MKSIQEIFDLAISEGCYKNCGIASYPLMCLSLNKLNSKGIITLDELRYAKDTIRQYIKVRSTSFLSDALKEAGLPHRFEARLKIYKNWKNRPALTWKQKLCFMFGYK